MEYGYIRVSTKEQNEERQVIALKNFGIKKKNFYIDKKSGENFIRPAYSKLLNNLKEGDAIIIKSIDRLGRNYDEILTQWRIITKDIKADIVVIDMPLLNTRNRENGLTGVFISDLVLQILSYVAETEKENTKKRQAEGIAAAKNKGKHLGRPKKAIPRNFKAIKEMCDSKEITIEDAERMLKISRTTYKKWSDEFDKR